MMAPAVLRTSRCLLCPATTDDLEAIESAMRSPQFPSDLPLARLYAKSRLGQWLTDMCDRAARGECCIWSVQLHGKPICIGQVSILPIPGAEAWSLAFWLNPTQWGSGLAREAVAAVLQEAFATKALPEIRAGAALWNVRSLSLLESLGLRAVSVTEDGYRIDGKPQAVREFAVTRAEWMRKRTENAPG